MNDLPQKPVRVVIVAKTRMKKGLFCVGSMNLRGKPSYRLLLENGHNQPPDTPFGIGAVWDIRGKFRENPEIPHVEDFLVTDSAKTGRIEKLAEFIRKVAPFVRGGPQFLFKGKLMASSEGSGYIPRWMKGKPAFSTQFWISDHDLRLDGEYYKYPAIKTVDGKPSITRIPYIGIPPAKETLPAGTLLRASLARYWSPAEDTPEIEKKCFLQLSGWYEES